MQPDETGRVGWHQHQRRRSTPDRRTTDVRGSINNHGSDHVLNAVTRGRQLCGLDASHQPLPSGPSIHTVVVTATRGQATLGGASYSWPDAMRGTSVCVSRFSRAVDRGVAELLLMG